jgi:hypothetical protein
LAVRCRICGVPALRDYVDSALNKGLSNRAVAAGIDAMGGNLDPDVVGRHKNAHWVKPERPDAPKPTNRDLAIMVREKIADAVEDMPGEGLLLMGKELAPALNAGLKAQAMLDKREAVNKKLGIAAGALSLQMWLAGLHDAPPPPELDDGNTVEGVAVEVP